MKPCPICKTGSIENTTCNSCGYIYNAKSSNCIVQFCTDLVEGVGGLDDYEYYEVASPKYRREIAVAIYVIKCLANPRNTEAAEILSMIMEQRQ